MGWREGGGGVKEWAFELVESIVDAQSWKLVRCCFGIVVYHLVYVGGGFGSMEGKGTRRCRWLCGTVCVRCYLWLPWGSYWLADAPTDVTGVAAPLRLLPAAPPSSQSSLSFSLFLCPSLSLYRACPTPSWLFSAAPHAQAFFPFRVTHPHDRRRFIPPPSLILRCAPAFSHRLILFFLFAVHRVNTHRAERIHQLLANR